MAFADPQSIKINGVTTSLPRVASGKGESTYQSNDGLISLEAASTSGSRTRRLIRANISKITTDPYIPAQNVKVSTSCYLVFDIPPAGYTVEEEKKLYEGFIEALQASSGKLITQLLGGES